MPTKRRGTTAVTSKEHLIVAGGTIEIVGLNTIEVMDTKSLVWSKVASLPHPYSNASTIICGDQLYMLGGFDNKDKTKSVLTCSLTELLQSSPSSSSIWHRVADAPAYYSTCAAVNGELLAVGGCDKDETPSSAIHKYNPTTNSWDLISNMPTARYDCLVAVLPTNEVMVVGGSTVYFSIDKIEIAMLLPYVYYY
jgi:N-acetylneuraminic acid mutarotase